MDKEALPSFIDPEFDDIENAEEELREQFKGFGDETY